MPRPSAQLKALQPAIASSLERQAAWFTRMIGASNDRIMAYKYLPDADNYVFEPSPIRELGTAATLGAVQLSGLVHANFDPAIAATIARYEAMIVKENTLESEGPATAEGLGGTVTEAEISQSPLPFAILDSQMLREPSSIAHNAMFLLALLNNEHYPDESRKEELLRELAYGIVHQQQKTGRFKIYFEPGSIPNTGWELYSGEAELALIRIYGRLRDWKLIHGATRAFRAYTATATAGRVRSSTTVFFANWQCQAGRALLQHTTSLEKISSILYTMCSLQDGVVHDRKLFEVAALSPEGVSVVELACGLEGLGHTYAALLSQNLEGQEDRLGSYEEAILAGVEFLLRVQRRSEMGAGDGGFGFSTQDATQRIDVTGHVANAFLLLLELLA